MGSWQYDLSFEQAAESYLLSIGDGLVAQIPSASRNCYSNHRNESFDKTRVAENIGLSNWYVTCLASVAAVLLLMGFIRYAEWIISGGGIICLAPRLFSKATRACCTGVKWQPLKRAAENETPAAPDQINLADVTDNSPVSVQLGYGLIEMVNEDTGGPLINRITGIRKQVSRALGFVVPPVRVRDDMSLGANDYRIRIGQTIVGEDKFFPDRKLAIPGDATNIKISGIEVKDPSFGMDAIWIERHQKLRLRVMDMWLSNRVGSGDTRFASDV